MARIVFQDEEGQNLNRYLITPTDGSAPFLADLTRAATITHQGTPYNKEVGDHFLQVEDGTPIQTFSCTKSGTNYALTGLTATAGLVSCVFRADTTYKAGDTFTVEGTEVSVLSADNSSMLPAIFFSSGETVSFFYDIENHKVYFQKCANQAARLNGTAIGPGSHAEGISGTASGPYSHAEGYAAFADGYGNHAEGIRTQSFGGEAHSIASISGQNLTLVDQFGNLRTTPATNCFYILDIEGNILVRPDEITATYWSGLNMTVSGVTPTSDWKIIVYSMSGVDGAHSEGMNTTAVFSSHAEGHDTVAINSSHAEGIHTIADYSATHAQGRYNKPYSSTPFSFVIGNGSSNGRSNAFRVTNAGQVYGLASFNSSGADYSEFFEWQDENPDKEDRIGRFVTLEGEKIKYANDGDYIIGIVSGTPAIIGDHPSESWHSRWIKDIFGRIQYHKVQVPDQTDTITHEDGTTETVVIIPAHTEQQPIPDPEYDPAKEAEYANRESRPEWATVGMLGKLVCIDDGTCEVNGYCKPVDGIATKADAGYRVLARLDDTHVKVLIK